MPNSDADKNLKTSTITMSVCGCWDPCVRMWTACSPMVSQSLLGFGHMLQDPFIELSYLKLCKQIWLSLRCTSISIDCPMSESVKSTSYPITDMLTSIVIAEMHFNFYCWSSVGVRQTWKWYILPHNMNKVWLYQRRASISIDHPISVSAQKYELSYHRTSNSYKVWL